MKVSSPPPTIMQQNKKGNAVFSNRASGQGDPYGLCKARGTWGLGSFLVLLGAGSCETLFSRASLGLGDGWGQRTGKPDYWVSVTVFP